METDLTKLHELIETMISKLTQSMDNTYEVQQETKTNPNTNIQDTLDQMICSTFRLITHAYGSK